MALMLLIEVESTNLTRDDLKADVIVKISISTSVQQNESHFSSLESTDDVELELCNLNLHSDCEGHTSAKDIQT